jgi:hypothetical protein
VLPHLRKTVAIDKRKSIGVKSPFSPNFDGNAVAWYDGDIDLTAAQWNDQGAGGHDLIFVNAPTVDAVGLNGHGTVLFDGINQSGQVLTPANTQPTTVYLVTNYNWIVNTFLFDGALVGNRNLAFMPVGAPRVDGAAVVQMQAAPAIVPTAWGVYTFVFNGAASEIRTDLNAAVVGNMGGVNLTGLTIAARWDLGAVFHGNVEFAYIIIRNGADSTATQNQIINALNARFGLAFDPDFDGNALSWYDGDAGLNAATWLDASGGGNNITFFNAPTIDPVGLNGHGTVLFDGINQYGTVALPAVNQPYTVYLVQNLVTWTQWRRTMADGGALNVRYVRNRTATPNQEFFNGSAINGDPDLALGTFGVLTLVGNGVASEFRTNLNAAVIGDSGANNGTGITIGAAFGGAGLEANVQFAYVIIRTGADSLADQNTIINGLMQRFGL